MFSAAYRQVVGEYWDNLVREALGLGDESYVLDAVTGRRLAGEE